jgi:cytochrome P450
MDQSSLTPLIVTDADVRAGRVGALHAEAAARVGAVFASNSAGDWVAGPCVVVTGHDALAAATGDARDAFSSELGWAQVLGSRFGRAVVNVDDPQHVLDRKRWSALFAPASLDRCAPALRALIESRCARWAGGSAFDVYPATRELAFAAVATTLAGFADDPTMARVLYRFSEILIPSADDESDAVRHQRALPARDDLDSLVDAHVTRMLAGADPNNLVAQLRRQAPELDAAVLAGHLNLLLVTGHETSASMMAWLLYYAARPQWSTWLREEFAEAGAPAADLSIATLDALPRVDRFVREAMRLHPAVVCAPRVTLRDVDVAGVRIPRHARVALSYAGTNLLRSVYADPLAFEPDRWLDTSLPLPSTFSSGNRLCMGIRFAHLEFKLLLSHMLIHYEFDIDGDVMLVNAGFWNARPSGRFRLRMRSGSIAK